MNGKTIPLWRDPRLPSEYVSVHGYVPPRLTGIEITLISLNWLRHSLRVQQSGNFQQSSVQTGPILPMISNRKTSPNGSYLTVLSAHRLSYAWPTTSDLPQRWVGKGFFWPLVSNMATARTIISPSAPRHRFRWATSTLPIRRRIQLQRKFTTCESPECFHFRTHLTDMPQIGNPTIIPPHPTDLLIRSTVIDNALPVSSSGDVLSLSTGSSHALWPRLLEKAVGPLEITR